MRYFAPKANFAFILSAAVLATIGTSAAIAQTAPAAPSATTSDEAEEAASTKKICRRVEKTGSRMAVRVCKTEAQWAALESGELGAEIQMKSDGATIGAGSGGR